MSGKKAYSLKEMVKMDIDAWVEAISYVANTEEGREICPEDDCPAEHEFALTDLSEKMGYRFNADGSPVAYTVRELEKASEEADEKCTAGDEEAADEAEGWLSAWSFAIHFVADTEEGLEICPEEECPSDYRDELYALADEKGYLFDSTGNVIK